MFKEFFLFFFQYNYDSNTVRNSVHENQSSIIFLHSLIEGRIIFHYLINPRDNQRLSQRERLRWRRS